MHILIMNIIIFSSHILSKDVEMSQYSENQIYSWGNGESGRLGGTFSDQGTGPNKACTALPRPIFGSMHVVSSVSCRHWNSLIIAGE